jgi:hypothetical protein
VSPILANLAPLAAPFALVVVVVLAAYLVFRRVEGDANRARRRTERSSRKAAGGLVAAFLGVLGGLAGIWTEVADGLGEAVALVGTPAGETVGSLVAGGFAAYASGVVADFPFTTAVAVGFAVFAVAVGVTRA